MNKKKKIVLTIVLAILIPIVVFFTLYLYHVVVYLKPEPLRVQIMNEDTVSHKVNVKVVYEQKEIYNKTFNLKSKCKVSTGVISKKEGKYELIVTLDGRITKTFIAKVRFSYSRVDVFIVNKSGKVETEIYQAVY